MQARDEEEPRKSQATRELQAMVYQSIHEEMQNWIPREWTPLPDRTGDDAGRPATYEIHSGDATDTVPSFGESDTSRATTWSRTS